MNYTRRRIAVFLTLLLIVPAILNCIPGKTLVAHAETTAKICWDYVVGKQVVSESGYSYTDNSNGELVIEAGQTGNLASLAYVSTNYARLHTLSGVTYATNNAAVATINKGMLNALTTGVATITITYNGMTTTCTVNVVAKGSLGSGKNEYKKIVNVVNSLLKAYGKKITTKNRYEVNNLLHKVYKTYTKCSTGSSG